jgi:hypothetical protein
MIIDPKLKAYIRPLSENEYQALESSIVADGCRDALVVWDGILIDGHNRYAICTKHDLAFDTVEMAFKNIDEAKEWMLLNQLGRRNLSDYDRTVLALMLEDLYAARGKANMVAGAKGLFKKTNPIEPVNTRKTIAEIAGVSETTVGRVKIIQEKGTPELHANISSGAISINKAYSTIAPKPAAPKPAAPKKIAPKKVDPEEYTAEKFELDNAHNAIATLQQENQSLNDKLAVNSIDGGEEEKLSAEKIISDLRDQIVTLNKEIESIRANRDTYLTENSEMKKQIKYLQKQLKKGE